MEPLIHNHVDKVFGKGLEEGRVQSHRNLISQRQLWHPLTAFFAANHSVLDPLQKEVLHLILHEFEPPSDPGLKIVTDLDKLAKAIDLLSKKADHLELTNWTPQESQGDDMVRGPNHYMRNPIEPTFFNMELGLNWLLGNAVKYVMRYQFKNGPQDLRKAARNIEMYIRWLSGEAGWSR